LKCKSEFDQTPDLLPTNDLIMELVNLHPPNCSECPDNEPRSATQFCPTCNQNLCQLHVKFHSETKSKQLHSLTSIDQGKPRRKIIQMVLIDLHTLHPRLKNWLAVKMTTFALQHGKDLIEKAIQFSSALLAKTTTSTPSSEIASNDEPDWNLLRSWISEQLIQTPPPEILTDEDDKEWKRKNEVVEELPEHPDLAVKRKVLELQELTKYLLELEESPRNQIAKEIKRYKEENRSLKIELDNLRQQTNKQTEEIRAETEKLSKETSLFDQDPTEGVIQGAKMNEEQYA